MHTYIFNNGDDYKKYGTLIPGFSMHQDMINSSGGMTNGESVSLYKSAYMDNVLAHELGHVFQFRLSEAKVRELDYVNGQLMANAIGLEVEEKNQKAICEQKGVDEYIDRGWMFKFKYKDTTGSIYRKDLSEEEKFQIIQRVKNSGLDEYEDRGWMFQFKYKGTLYKYHKNLSEEEKFKAIQNVKNIHELVDEYEDHGSMFSFKYKGTNYDIQHKGYLSAEEEKLQFIKDIKNSHESLISECDGLGNENTTLLISVDKNKEISQMYFQNYDKSIFKRLDKTLISRSKPEQDVDDTDPKPGKEPEPESAEEDTQQPSNFLSNIFSTIKSIIDSISSLFSWLFGSKEKEFNQQSDDNPSLLELNVDQSNHDADENYVGNHSLCNHNYHQHDDLI